MYVLYKFIGIFRLYGGVQYSYRYTGIVELLYNGEWGAICNEGWGTEEALVLCRELGFASAYSGSTIRYTEARKGNSKYKTWLNEISCTGSEDGLSACSHSGIAPYDCSYQSYVTVDCNNGIYVFACILHYSLQLQVEQLQMITTVQFFMHTHK